MNMFVQRKIKILYQLDIPVHLLSHVFKLDNPVNGEIMQCRESSTSYTCFIWTKFKFKISLKYVFGWGRGVKTNIPHLGILNTSSGIHELVWRLVGSTQGSDNCLNYITQDSGMKRRLGDLYLTIMSLSFIIHHFSLF